MNKNLGVKKVKVLIGISFVLSFILLVCGFVFLLNADRVVNDRQTQIAEMQVDEVVNADSNDRYYLHGDVSNATFESNSYMLYASPSLPGWTYASGPGYNEFYNKVYYIGQTIVNESDTSYVEVSASNSGTSGWMRWTAKSGYAFAYWHGDGLSSSTPFYPVFETRRTVTFYGNIDGDTSTVYTKKYIGDGGQITLPSKPSGTTDVFKGWGSGSSTDMWTSGSRTITKNESWFGMWEGEITWYWSSWNQDNCTASKAGDTYFPAYEQGYSIWGWDDWAVSYYQTANSSIVECDIENGYATITYTGNSGYAFALWYDRWNYYSKVLVKTPYFATRRTVNFYYNISNTTTKYTTLYIGNGGELSLPNAPSREGYEFLGWASSSTGDVEWSSGTMVIDPGACDWWAKWTPITYTIAFAGMDGANYGTNHIHNLTTGGNVNDSDTAIFDEWFDLTNPTKYGYTFAGWNVSGMDNCDHELEWVGYGAGQDNSTSWTGVYEDRYLNLRSTPGTVTFTATWTPITYTITYAGMDGATQGTNYPDSVEYDQAFIVDSPKKIGYSFCGWIITGMDNCLHYWELVLWWVDGYTLSHTTTDTTIETGTGLGSFEGMNLRSTADMVTFTAVWGVRSYTVTLDKNHSDDNSIRPWTAGTESVTAVYDSEMPILENAPTRAGYTFAGYFDSDGTKYYNSDKSSAKNWDKGSDALDDLTTYILYAHWDIASYNLSLSWIGGEYGGTISPVTYSINENPQYATLTVSLMFGRHYAGCNIAWTDGNHGDALPTISENSLTIPAYCFGSITLTIEYNVEVSLPADKDSHTYNGGLQSPYWCGANNESWGDNDKVTIDGDLSGKDAGTYEVIFTPKSGYCWSDGSTGAKTVTWTISPKALVIASCSFVTNGMTSYSFSDYGTGIGSEKITLNYLIPTKKAGSYTYTEGIPSGWQFNLVLGDGQGGSASNYTVASAGDLTIIEEHNIIYVTNGGTQVEGFVSKYSYSDEQQDVNITYCTNAGYTATTVTSSAGEIISGGLTTNGTLRIPAGCTSEITVTWQWSANEITLPQQTEDFQAIYRTTGAGWTFEGALGGAGEYTYTVLNGYGGMTGITLSGTTFSGAPTSSVGTYTVLVQAKDSETNQTATAEYKFIVSAKNLTESMATFAQNGEKTYNAQNQYCPSLTLTDESYSLAASEYVLSGNTIAQKNVGTYSVTITGSGNYHGEITKNWYITKYIGSLSISFQTSPAQFEYDATQKNAGVIVKIGTTKVQDDDVNISYDTATNAGEYTAVIIGSNSNIASSVTASLNWKILPKQVAVVWDSYSNPEYNGQYHDLPTASANSGIDGQQIVLQITEKTLNVSTVQDVGSYIALASISSVNGGLANNYTLTNVEKPFEITKAGAVISKLADANIYVLQKINLRNYINVSEMVDESEATITYAVTAKENAEIVTEITNGSELKVTELAKSNDNAQTITVTVSIEATDNYSADSLNLTVTINKYQASINFTTAPQSIALGDTNRNVDATASSDGGTYGAITYSSSDVQKLYVDPNTGELTSYHAGNVTITATVASSKTVKGASTTCQIEITKQKIDDPSLKPGESYIYDGVEKVAQFVYLPALADVSGNTGTVVGEYTATFVLKNKADYQWKNAGDNDAKVVWNIEKRGIKRPTCSTTQYEYRASLITLDISDIEDQAVEISGHQWKNAGDYTAKIALSDKANTKWNSGNENEDMEISWKIVPASVVILDNQVTYSQTSDGIYVDEKYYTNVVNEYLKLEYELLVANAAGEYTHPTQFKVRLLDCDDYKASNYQITSVGKLVVSAFGIDVPVQAETQFVYDGTAKAFEFTNLDKFQDVSTIKIFDKNNNEISQSEAVNAGIYTVIVTLNSNYLWNDKTTTAKEFEFEILRAEIQKPELLKDSFEYDSQIHNITMINMNEFVSISGDLSGISVGEYTVIVSADQNHWFAVDGGHVTKLQLVWNITRAQIEKPQINSTFASNNVYSGSTISILDYVIFDDERISIDKFDATYTYYAKNVGTYLSKFIITEKTKYTWADGTNDDVIIEWSIVPDTVKIPNVVGSKNLTYKNEKITLMFEAYDDKIISITGNEQTYANKDNETYKAVLSLKYPNNYVWFGINNSENQIVEWTISKAEIQKPNIVGVYKYADGNDIEVEFDEEIDKKVILVEGGKVTNAGVYTVTLTLLDNNNYKWKGENNVQSLSYDWVVEKAYLDAPELEFNLFEYDGFEHTVELKDSETYQIVENESTISAINAGRYTIKVVVAEDYLSNYMFANNQEMVSVDWIISKKSVALPVLLETAYIYSGDTIKVKMLGFDESIMEIVGTTSETSTNIYRFEVKFIDDGLNHEWVDGTITPKPYTWSIVKSNAPLIVALSASASVAIASALGFTIYVTRKNKMKKLKLKQIDEE